MSGGHAVVTVTDHGSKKVVDAAKKRPSIDVGIIGPKASAKHGKGWGRGKKPTLATIAGFHEFGTKHIPKRPFIGGWFDKNRGEIQSFIAELTGKFLEGKLSTEKFVDLFGLKAVGGIQKFISRKIPPPLSPKSLAMRKRAAIAALKKLKPKVVKDKRGRIKKVKPRVNATPLIDTGLLRSSITFRLHRK